MLKKKIFSAILLLFFIFCSFTVTYAYQSSSATDAVETFDVLFKDGETLLGEYEIPANGYITELPVYDASGNLILGWVSSWRKISSPTSVPITADTVFTVWKPSQLKTDSHHPYITGSEGKFRPDEPLTRAEFCEVFNSIFDIYNNDCATGYFDLSVDATYYTAVSNVLSAGIMSGYDDGTFRPDAPMTKAEFLSVLGVSYIIEEKEAVFYDTVNHWAKNQIAFAYDNQWITDDTTYAFKPDNLITRAEAVAVFNNLLGRDATQNWATLSGSGVFPFYDVKPSVWYYCEIMEATVDHSFSGSTENEIWTGFSYKPSGFAPGIANINGNGYLVNENGQFCFFSPWSFIDYDNKTYFSNAEGAANLSFNGLTELYGSMYYFCEDGSILKNASFENLYFGSDGKYTSGSTELDVLVDQALAQCTNDGMTKSQKLRAAYLYLRDNCKYLGGPHFERGSNDFTADRAIFMFKNNLKGNCYCFASCFLYMARRLGYQDAYIVSGGVGVRNTNHSWVMINSNIYDPQLEYAHLYQYARKHHYDLYDLPVNNTPFVYYFPN